MKTKPMTLRGKEYTRGSVLTTWPEDGSFVVSEDKVWKVNGTVHGLILLLRGGHALYTDDITTLCAAIPKED